MNYKLYALMILFGLIGSYLYIMSSMPEHLKEKHGETSYDRCKRMRVFASIPLCVSFLYYFCYNQEQLNIVLPYLPLYFPEPFKPLISWFLALAFLIPGIYVFYKGRKTLGIESDNPKTYHNIVCTGVYKYIRHPQLLGEICFWYFFAFLWCSPLLVLTTTIFWVPNYILWCYCEEKDLLLRYGDEYAEYKKKTKCLIPFIF